MMNLDALMMLGNEADCDEDEVLAGLDEAGR
jgi:hypothetical protein